MTKRNIKYRLAWLLLLVAPAFVLCGCHKEEVESNKEERNAIKKGNKLYDQQKFQLASDEYAKALEANPGSDAARFNKAMADMLTPNADSTKLANADKALKDLAEHSTQPGISERALFNLGDKAVYTGDMLKEMSSQPGQEETAQQASQMSTQFYKQAIEYYKALLRKNPANVKALQNLRVAQLKLPPEDQNGGGGGGQDNQQNQDQQQQQQPQPQPQQPNENDKQVLQSVQQKENQTRKNQPAEPAALRTTDKPW